MKTWDGLSIIAIVAAIAGCAAIGLSSPKGFDESLAEAYGVHTAIVQATTTALVSGTITSAEASAVKAQADTARTMLDTAKSLESVNSSSAQNDLTLASTALSAIQTYLNAQGEKK